MARELSSSAIDGIAAGVIVLAGDGAVIMQNAEASALLASPAPHTTLASLLAPAGPFTRAGVASVEDAVAEARRNPSGITFDHATIGTRKIETTLRVTVDGTMVLTLRDVSALYRIEALRTLTRSAVHEINNQLTVILGNAAILEAELADNADLGPIAADVVLAGKGAGQLATQLLERSRRDG